MFRAYTFAMKKILIYTDTTQTGGAELQMFLLAKFLNKEKFTPLLACSNHQNLNKWCENFEKEQIKVIRINAKSKHSPKHFFALNKLIKSEKIDLIHSHVWNPASSRYAFLSAIRTNKPIITTEHDPFKLSKIKDIFKKFTLKKITKIITVSENNKKILQNLYPNQRHKILTILNGIDTTWWQSQLLRFTPEDLKKIKTETFEAKENTLILIAISELHERKGLKYLIKAMPSITEKYPNVKLVIIGEGPEKENLKNLIEKLKLENNVILLGKKKEIPKLLKSSDIFILPSLREAFGLVNLEAMMAGLPIIATRVGGIPEVVKHKETGLLIKPADERALSQAINQMIASPTTRKKMGTAGKKRAEKQFSAKKMAEEYEKIYATILS